VISAELRPIASIYEGTLGIGQLIIARVCFDPPSPDDLGGLANDPSQSDGS